jgi:pyruvate carboxylase subunit B
VQDEHDLLLEEYGLDEAGGAAEREIRAPMPGLVLSVMVEDGQAVSEGDGLVVLEAMKMENELRAPADGVVKTVHVAPQDAVDKDALLIEMEANPDA